MVHTAGRDEEHADEDVLQRIVFNDNIKGRQGKVDTPGITSWPDQVEFKRQDLNTHSQITHTWNEWTHNYMKRTIYGNKRREHKTHTKHL